MTYSLCEVKNKKELKAFVDLPWTIYKSDPHWVAPLKMAVNDLLNPKHPFWENAEKKLLLVYKDQKAVGRLAVIVNHSFNQFHQSKEGHFGLFESIDDPQVAKMLFDEASDYLKKQGMKSMVGPYNPSTNYECGLLVEGPQDPAQIMMTYNPPYYEKLMLGEGLAKAKDLLAYQLPTSIDMPEKIVRLSKRVEEKKGVTFRPISKKHWQRDVELLFEIYNDAWEKNWGFVPMTKKEFFHSAKDLKAVVVEDLVLFVEVDGKAQGLIIALPDFNQVLKNVPSGKLFPLGLFKILTGKKHINRARILTMGLKQKFRRSGLETVLYVKIQEMMQKLGLQEAEMSWILEDNYNMNRPLQLMGAKAYKRYRLYQGQLH